MAPPDQLRKRKRGRPSAADIAAREADEIASPPDATPAPKRKRGRPSNASKLESHAEPEEREEPSSSKPNHQQGQPSNANLDAQTSTELSARGEKKKGRRRTNAEILADREAEAEDARPSTKRKRGRPSIGNKAKQNQPEQEPEDEAEQPVVKKRRRRRTNAEILADNQAQVGKSERNHTDRRSSNRSQASASQPDPSASQGTHRQRVQRDRDEQPTDDEDEISKPEYQYMRPLTRQVPRDVIENKWTTLPDSAVIRVNDLFHDIARPVPMQLRDERKRLQASTAIDMVIRRLGSKLTKGMPFPPATGSQREDDFNSERVLDATRALEAQLTPMLHSIELLKAERKVEEQLLADDEANLEHLEENAKRAEQGRRKSARKLHFLLQEDMAMNQEELENQAGFLEQRSSLGLALDVSTDDELMPLVQQLNNHLDSLQSNLAPIGGIDTAILRTKAAVDDVLFKHLNAEEHEQVVRGR